MMKNIIWFIHVPKTGGTSINTFSNNTEFKNSEYVSFSHDSYSPEREAELYKKGKLHKVVALRDPITHAKSLYSYIKADRAHGLHEEANDMTFSEWIRHYERMKNFYVKFFDPENLSVDHCVNILLDFEIIKTHTLTEDFNTFLKSIGESELFDVHNNRSKDIVISDNDVEYLKGIRSKDYELLKRLGWDESIYSNIDKE